MSDLPFDDSAMAEEPGQKPLQDQDIPDKIGKYELVMAIARGSMGAVYFADDSFGNRPVAIKVAHSKVLQDKQYGKLYQRMFFNEAQTAGMLHHPSILEMYDAGVEDDCFYIVMEYVEGGGTLKGHIKPDTLLPIEKVIEIIFRCARALDYAHSKGVIHRDIKPSNILLTPDMEVKLADFSIAYVNEPDMTLTQPMGLVGSPLYMSPEQVREEELNHQTDLFSLGVVMYEMLTGKHPFAATSFSQLIHKITNQDPRSPRQLRPDIPEPLEAIVLKAIAKDRKVRFQTGAEFAAALSDAFTTLDQPEQEISSQEKFLAVRELRFFRDFPESEIWEVIRASTWMEFGPEEEILIEGEIDEAFYIITTGEVQVKKGKSVIGSLGLGDCFGEMGYVAKTKRIASIVANSDVAVMKVTSTHIDQTSLSCQLNFHKVFLRTLIGRLSRATERLAQTGI
ncbi:MAG: serine/threonine protein kinase [Proteobacteria bacterium]|nr:MAG: serine/threonine protein kinase [Pseudomonadota bacterium]